MAWRLLTLRARRPEPFAGAYEAVPAGDDTCAFVRGGEVLVVVAVRCGAGIGAGVRPEGILEAPRGRWRDVLRGGERSFHRRVPIADVVDDHGLAVYERVGG
ncbi:MAG: hypothetical protein DLM64_06870 [Solirubrobacterales bacterium]|nr:MAG: hypothetical protein DLM64_06870 [Solirubrobacterales bacterium]